MTTNQSGDIADQLISTEVSGQEKMWGASEERADVDKNSGAQLLGACAAQIVLVRLLSEGCSLDDALKIAYDASYPSDWDKAAFRSYGSHVANLVVAAAFLRNEIKRRIANGEDTTRTKRGEAYTTAQPYMSFEEASK